MHCKNCLFNLLLEMALVNIIFIYPVMIGCNASRASERSTGIDDVNNVRKYLVVMESNPSLDSSTQGNTELYNRRQEKRDGGSLKAIG